ncbi:TonB-dependent siderophore receptor [Novosphingobium sp. Rr 2-17]|uniref:TonB-dependent siderophore receptor n=1 Tax=Novosphingobium sp. Rr 2-17 TaxID=555793 RepID=UPI001ED8F77B|nr:TonB-dependent siderophore receptor [Novosphingobium sp. Rr 2-17]
MLTGLALCPAAYAAEDETKEKVDTTTAERDKVDILVTGLRPDDGQNQRADNGALGVKTLLDTPFSVAVIDEEDINKRQANSISQMFINDASVFSSAPAATTNWWGTQIRGLGVRNYYIDDVPLLLYWGGDFPLESIERVTALKGLTGFMYGFGAPGGAISYRTKRPTSEPMLTTEIGYRTNSVFYARIDAGGPLTQDGKLGYRVNLAGEKGTAYNQAGVNRLVGSLALDYTFNSALHWYATATYENSNLKHEPFQIYWSSYEGDTLPKVTYDYDKLNIDNSYYKSRTLAAATGLDWTFADGWSARMTYGYTSKLHHSNKMFVYMLNQAGDYEGYAYNFAELDQTHFLQAMVQGEFTTGPVRHEIVAGTSFQAYHSEFGLDDYHWGNDFNGNIYQDQTFRVTRSISYGTQGSPSEEQQRALFMSDTLHLGEHVQAMLGARYTRYKLLDLDGDATTDTGYKASALSPTIALIYKPVPYVSIYGSYVEAMEAGSRVGAEYANAGEVLGATISRQYEIGAKYEHQGLSLTTAAFRIERANTIDQIDDGVRRLTQDGLTLYKGIEANVSYRVTPRLRLGLGALHLDPSIQDVSPENENLRGNVPDGAAKWQAVGNAEYYVAAIPGLSLHGTVRYNGKAPTSDDNTLYIPAYTTANLGFQYQTQVCGQKVTFTGNINNLLNAKYWTQTNVGEGINGSLSARVSW